MTQRYCRQVSVVGMAAKRSEYHELESTPSGESKLQVRDTGDTIADKVRVFLRSIPILSIIVGGTLLLLELVVIAIVLAGPNVFGLSEDFALLPKYRYTLGAATIVIVIEALALGISDTGYTGRKLKRRQDRALRHFSKLRTIGKKLDDQRSSDPDSMDSSTGYAPPEQLFELMVDNLKVIHPSLRSISSSNWMEQDKKTTEQAAKRHTRQAILQYIAALIFEMAKFLWKWALAILVIRNNWISVGVTIVGGVFYPVVVVWQKCLSSQ